MSNAWGETDHRSFRAAMIMIAICVAAIAFSVSGYYTAKTLHSNGAPCTKIKVQVTQS